MKSETVGDTGPKKGRGRPKGEVKVVVKMRLLPSVAGAVREWYEAGAEVDDLRDVGVGAPTSVPSHPDQFETIKELGQEIEQLKGELALKGKGMVGGIDLGGYGKSGMDFKPEGELWSYGELKKQAGMAAESARVAGEKVEELEGRLQRCAEATDDQKARWWMVKCKEAQARVKQLEDGAS